MTVISQRNVLLVPMLAFAMTAAAQEPPTVFAPLEPSALEQFKADALSLLNKNGIGKQPWLFYGDELRLNERTVEDYLTVVPMIVDLHEQLKSAGVELIYMPVTPKWAVYPDAISDAAKPDGQGRIPRMIPETAALFEALRAKGVTCVDLTEPHVKERYGEHGPVHLHYDTHWSPAGMAVAGRALAEVIRERPWYQGLPGLSGVRGEWRPVELVNNDIRQPLAALGDNDPIKDWPKAEGPVNARYVSGCPKRADAPIVVVGDSNLAAFDEAFNVAAQVAYELKLPVDQIGVPVDGCIRELGRKGYGDPAYLLSKKVVVYLHTGRGMGGPQVQLPVVADKHRTLRHSVRTGTLREEELVLQGKPDALWPLDDPWGLIARDLSGHSRPGMYEAGVTFSHPRGKPPAADAPPETRAVLFAGGRMFADLPAGKDYTLALWVRRDAAAAAAGIWGIGDAEDTAAAGDQLIVNAAGTLAFSNGRDANLAGKTAIPPETWHHVALVRQGDRLACYLDGKEEFSGTASLVLATKAPRLFLGGNSDKTALWQGRLCEAAFYVRALSAADVAAQFAAWLPVATLRGELAIEIDPAAGLDSITLRTDDADATPVAATPLTRVTKRAIARQNQSGETLPLDKLAAGTVDLKLQIEFAPLGGATRAEAPVSLKITPNTAAVDTDVIWTGNGVLPSGRTANEWWRGRNWQGGQPPAFDTKATVVFENDAPSRSRLARNRSVGGLVARGEAGGHTVELGGKTLTLKGDLSVDLAADTKSPFAIAEGTLRLGDKETASRVRVKNGALRLDAGLDLANVESVLVPDDGGGKAALVVGGDGTLATRRLHLAAGAGEAKADGTLAVPAQSRLEKIAVADSLRIAATDAPGERASVQNGFDAGGGDWALPDGIDFAIGSPAQPAAELLIGQGQGESKRGSLAAGAGGIFTAHVKRLDVGAMTGPGTGWAAPPAADVAGAKTPAGEKPAAAAIAAERIDPGADNISVEARAMQLDDKRERVNVKSVNVTGSLAKSSGTLLLNGPAVLETDTFDVASPGRATLSIPEGSPLKKIAVRDRFRLAAGEWSTSLENGSNAGGESWLAHTEWGRREAVIQRGVCVANWMLPDGISFEIGSREKPASEFTLGLGDSWSARGCLVAGAGGVFSANATLMQIGCMTGGGPGWFGAMQPEVRYPQMIPPFSVGNDHWGILDLSRMERCDITVGDLRVGHAAVAADGAQLVGQLLLPKGNVTAGSVTVGHAFPVCLSLFIGDPEWGEEGAFRVGTEGRLELNGTVLGVGKSLAIPHTGVVNAHVSDTSGGPDLAAAATLAIEGNGRLNLVFKAPPRTAGLYYGFRWEGDHRDALEGLIAAGQITIDTAAFGPDAGVAGVFTGEEKVAGATRLYTYIGFRNAPDAGGNAFAGMLDLSRMERCEIVAGELTVGHTTIKSWGAQLKGRLLLPKGTLQVESAAIGHDFPVSEKTGSDAFRSGSEGRLVLNGTVFKVGKRLDVFGAGGVETRVSEASAGLDLAAAAAVAIPPKGGMSIVFEALPQTAGLFHGLRWEGDHRAELEKWVKAGAIAVDDEAVRAAAGPAGVFTGQENGKVYSYIGYPDAPKGTKPVAAPALAAVKPKPAAENPAAQPVPAAAGAKDGPLVVTAQIMIVSKPPVPRKDPYADALTTTQYKVLKVEGGVLSAKEILAIEPVMKNYELLPAANHKVGDVHRLTLIPWEEKVAKEPAIEKTRTLDDIVNYELDLFWIDERAAGP
ncbi:MAG: alginate O-acetyltransferase AlgX-related protein [Planctomycetota bacterium]